MNQAALLQFLSTIPSSDQAALVQILLNMPPANQTAFAQLLSGVASASQQGGVNTTALLVLNREERVFKISCEGTSTSGGEKRRNTR